MTVKLSAKGAEIAENAGVSVIQATKERVSG
jgi:hypothetical protein